MPAPPPESDVAIVSARGTAEVDGVMRAPPFAGTNRIRFDGCDLSPGQGTPVHSTLASPP
jgi:hypothetical protein